MRPPPAKLDVESAVARLLQPGATIDSVPAGTLHGKRVLYRADLNLPLTREHSVADATRLTSILPTLNLLLARGARVVICSHLGRPDPATQTDAQMRAAFSLAPVAALLQQQLGAAFTGLVPDCVGPSALQAVEALQPGQVCVPVVGAESAAGGSGSDCVTGGSLRVPRPPLPLKHTHTGLPAGEPALPRWRGGRRARVRGAAGSSGVRVRERCVWRVPPPPGQHHGALLQRTAVQACGCVLLPTRCCARVAASRFGSAHSTRTTPS
jgi:hypothetical protein